MGCAVMCSVRGATERGGVRDHRGVRYPTNECNRVLRAVLVGGRRGHGCMRRCSAGSHSHRRRAQNHALVHAPARPARRCHGRAQMARARRAAGVIHRSPARAAVSALPHCAGATAQRRDERRTLGRMWTSAAGEPKVLSNASWSYTGRAARQRTATARHANLLILSRLQQQLALRIQVAHILRGRARLPRRGRDGRYARHSDSLRGSLGWRASGRRHLRMRRTWL